ncbi:MAG: response regulator [Proteobacteria bacterium]|nr:response regulator [Pseudomonadota bacterium]
METALHEEAPRVLVVDDEKVIRGILSDFLTTEGLVVRTAENGEAALAELQQRSYNLVISDLKMPRMGGLELLEAINRLQLPVLTIIITGFGTVETAIEAMKRGAYDYVLKPFKVEDIVHIVKRALERQRLERENMRLREAVSVYKISEAISQSLSVEPILRLLVDTAIDELGADAVTLLLEDEENSGSYSERLRRCRNGHEQALTEPRVGELLRCYEGAMPVLAHGARLQQFFPAEVDAESVVAFCSIPLVVHHRIVGMLNACSYTRGRKFNEGQRKMLAVLGSRAAFSIENARLYQNLLDSKQRLEVANLSLEENFRQTIVGFANALEESDRYTRGHSERVSVFARLIAEGLGLSERDLDRVVLSAKVHDIGKIGIPSEKLNKAGRLTPDEIAIFRTHPEKGRRILDPIPFLRDLVPAVYCHHERYDGSGYPQGLSGDRIPLIGRIISVADTYDAMTTDRAYRRALPHAAARAELQRCAGTQFDPEIVAIFERELGRLGFNRDDPGQLVLPSIALVGGY